MSRGGKSWVAAAGLLAAGCAAGTEGINVRPIADPAAKLREGNGDLAAARGQLALGNVGLALEAFRKLQRAQPENVEVLAGIAECYSAMGRHDVARAKYEAALAIEPRNADLLQALAAVLDRSGQNAEAAAMRGEAARMRAALATAAPVTARPAEPPIAAPKATPRRNAAADWSPTDQLAKLAADRPTVRVPAAQPTNKLRNNATNLLASVREEFQIEAPAAPTPVPPPKLSNSVTVPLPPARPAHAGNRNTSGAPAALKAAVSPALSNSVTVQLPPARPASALRGPVVNVLSAVREDLDVEAPAVSLPARKQAAAVKPGSVTVQLPPARPAERLRDRVTNVLAAAAEIRLAPAPTPERAGSGPRLERLSPAEVALVTSAQPIWRAPTVPSARKSATVQWIPLHKASRPNVLVLNAARFHGIAGRARGVLTDRGWRRIQVGDAPAVREKSVVLYPAHRRTLGRSLAAQFGFAAELSPNVDVPIVLVGRDAAALRLKRRG